MPRDKDIQHSVLIASASEQFVMLVRKSLKNCLTMDCCKSGSMARRNLLEKDYDLIVINIPLPDETGEALALDAAGRNRASVMLAAPQEVSDFIMDQVSDYGILVIPKPATAGRIDRAIRFLTAIQNRIHIIESRTRRLEEKMEETRIVNKAKFLLVEKKDMTEDQAHRWIGSQAMNHGVSRKRIAQSILNHERNP